MADETSALILDMVEWLAARPRAYDEAIEAWRTSCPRLTVWEDAFEQGLVARELRSGGRATVAVTPRGRALLRAAGRSAGEAGPVSAGSRAPRD